MSGLSASARSRILDAAVVVVSICAVAVTGLRVREIFFPAQTNARPSPTAISNWQDYAATGERMGPVAAAVTIVEFSDFQCPYCQKAAQALRDLRRQYSPNVAVLYRHSPLEFHKFAYAAAIAAVCAGRQGRFEPFHDLLFGQQDSIGAKTWNRFAMEAGVQDTTRFASCMADSSAVRIVQNDEAAAKKLKVQGTPTFLVNDVKVVGFTGREDLESQIKVVLKKRGMIGRTN